MPRMMSVRRDMNDDNALSWGRYKHMGATVASEYYQPCPFFFTREKWPLQLVGMYRGGSAFLIAGGPSFKNVSQKLIRKAGVWTITLNNAVRTFRGNAACIVDDPNRFVASLWLDPCIMKFVPASHFDKPMWDTRTLVHKDGRREDHWCQMEKIKVGDCPNVIGYHRNEKLEPWRFLYEDTINWGNHADFGGGRSVMLATLRILFLLGFRKVYLLGVDFDMSSEKRYHFEENRTNSAVKGNLSTYSKMMQWFEQLQPYFLAEKFIVSNCNPESKLKAFPFVSVEDAVYDATFELGDVENERTEGLYVKYEDKIKGARPPMPFPNAPQPSQPPMPPRETAARSAGVNAPEPQHETIPPLPAAPRQQNSPPADLLQKLEGMKRHERREERRRKRLERRAKAAAKSSPNAESVPPPQEILPPKP